MAQVALFLRACDDDLKVTEEFLELIPIHGTTTGEDINDAVWSILDKYKLPLNKLVAVTTDGAPAMTGKVKGFVSRLEAKLKDKYPEKLKLQSFHCIIHQQVLCSKILKMDNVLKTISKSVNFIRSRGLNHRQFCLLLQDLESEFEGLPYYTEVRWLSCHNVLKRFYLLLEEIILFLEMKVEDVSVLKDKSWVQDLVFLVDITGLLSELNIKLQGRDQLITHMNDTVASFKKKLIIWQNHLKVGNLAYFPMCQQFKNQSENYTFSKYCDRIEKIKDEFDTRFKDFEEHQDEFSIFTGPFSFDIERAPISIQMELIDLQNDSILKAKYQEVGIPKMYSYLGQKYPEMRKFVARILCYFGSTYLCEQLFSRMKANKTAHRSRLSDTNLSAIMKTVCYASFTPDIARLVGSKRCQMSGKKV